MRGLTIKIILWIPCFFFSNENLEISLISSQFGYNAFLLRELFICWNKKKQKHFLFDLKQVKNDSGFRDKHINYYCSAKKTLMKWEIWTCILLWRFMVWLLRMAIWEKYILISIFDIWSMWCKICLNIIKLSILKSCYQLHLEPIRSLTLKQEFKICSYALNSYIKPIIKTQNTCSPIQGW